MAYDISKVRFLVVEDNPAILLLLRSLLTGLGVEKVATATSADEGKRLAVSVRPDIVITDFKMEKASGVDFVRWLRRDPESPNQEVAVIMTSAYSESDRVIAARDAGVNEFLVKPITVYTLYQRIRSVIENDRLFVRAGGYVGPCRRRINKTDYAGPFRRAEDGDRREAEAIDIDDGDGVVEIAL